LVQNLATPGMQQIFQKKNSNKQYFVVASAYDEINIKAIIEKLFSK